MGENNLTVKEVWLRVFISALPAYGVDRAALVANSACDLFEKRFAPPETKTPETKAPTKPTEVKA